MILLVWREVFLSMQGSGAPSSRSTFRTLPRHGVRIGVGCSSRKTRLTLPSSNRDRNKGVIVVVVVVVLTSIYGTDPRSVPSSIASYETMLVY